LRGEKHRQLGKQRQSIHTVNYQVSSADAGNVDRIRSMRIGTRKAHVGPCQCVRVYKRAGLYVRVSTEAPPSLAETGSMLPLAGLLACYQRTDLQGRHLTEYVERRGWKLHKI
jgi:hypothetical protein